MAVLSLVFSAATGAAAASIDYRPALIPIGEPPLPVPLAIEPQNPTTADTIAFTAPLDGELYSNSCFAAVAHVGLPVLDIDAEARTINISFNGISSERCILVYDPVVGAFGDFGKLSTGDWTFLNSHGGSLNFTVVPEPSSLILFVAGAIGLLGCGWRRRTRTT